MRLAVCIAIVALGACAGAPRTAPNAPTEIAVTPVASAHAPSIAPPSAPPPAEPARAARSDGLVIEELVVGKGREVHSGDRVRVHYDGRLEDGTMFDSSRTRGEPATFVIGKGQLIQGWERGVPGMREGGVRKLVVPYALAYGENGRPPTIPERATLVFEIELLEVLGP